MNLILVEKYEEKAWAISEPDPIEAIKLRMELWNTYRSNKNIIKLFTPIYMTKLELRHE